MNSFLSGTLATFHRELLRILKSKDLLLICFLAPLFYGATLSSVYYNKRIQGVPIGVIDKDQSKLSRNLLRMNNATQNIELNKRFEDVPDALDSIMNEDNYGLIYIPRNFSQTIKHGKESYLLAGINSSNIIIANPILQSVTETSGTLASGIFINFLRKTGNVKDKALTLNQPLRADIRNVFNPNLNYSDFILPGLLIVILQQILLVGLGFTIAEEREKKRHRELAQVSKHNIFALLIGKSLPYLLINFTIGLLFILLVLPYFGIGPGGVWCNKLTLLFLFVTALTTFGVMISTLFKSTVISLIVLMFYSMPTFLISGFSWPSFALPWYLKTFSLLFPSTYFLSGYRLVLLGDVPMKYMINTITDLIGFSMICFVISYFRLKRIAQEEN